MTSDQTTWRESITIALESNGESWDDVLACTLAEEELDKAFNDGYGSSEGMPFTAWTRERVYFPAVYDGAEWVSSVPRNPCDERTRHVGGE